MVVGGEQAVVGDETRAVHYGTIKLHSFILLNKYLFIIKNKIKTTTGRSILGNKKKHEHYL